MKLLITGGHLTPALAFIDYLQTNHPSVNCFFVGRKYAQRSSGQLAHEETEVSKRKVTFIPFDSGKFTTRNPIKLIHEGGLFFTAFIRAFFILMTTKPTSILSFGGYLAVPIVLVGWILRIPIVTHEQTVTMGYANRVISLFAKKVAVSHADSADFAPKTKTVLTGLPIRSSLAIPRNKPSWLPKVLSKPILYITGGSQGSEIINSTIQNCLKDLTKQWLVIHQCGLASNRNYLRELQSASQSLPPASKNRYFVHEWITDEELGWIYQNASLVVSRSGANTVAELSAFQLPSIMVPLPFSHQNEQLRNAQILEKVGLAVVIEQKQLNPHTLLEIISVVGSNLKRPTIRKEITLTLAQASAQLYAVLQDVDPT